jgi:hypothetical protein
MNKQTSDEEFRQKLDAHLSGEMPFDVAADDKREQADLDATAHRLAQERAGRDWLESEVPTLQSAEIEDRRAMPGAGPVVWMLVGVFIVGFMLGGWIVGMILGSRAGN